MANDKLMACKNEPTLIIADGNAERTRNKHVAWRANRTLCAARLRKLSHETRDCNRQGKAFDRNKEGIHEQTSDSRFGYNFKYRARIACFKKKRRSVRSLKS